MFTYEVIKALIGMAGQLMVSMGIDVCHTVMIRGAQMTKINMINARKKRCIDKDPRKKAVLRDDDRNLYFLRHIFKTRINQIEGGIK